MKTLICKSLAAAAALGLGAGIALAGSAQPVAIAPASAHALLTRATRIGPHAPGARIDLTVSLKLRNVARLKTFLRDLQNPKSPHYRAFLTPAQFAAQYGPTQAQVDAVTGFLKAHGISVKDVSSNRILIHTQAPTSAYESAFGIGISDYTLDGRRFFSTMDRPRLPASIAGYVQNLIGLGNAAVMHPLHHIRPLAAGGAGPHVPAPPPQTSAYYRPAQIATAYSWPSITDSGNGAGVSTAILTADSAGLSSNTDYTNFWSQFGLPGHAITITPVDGTGSATDGLVETLLDMEWSGAMSPGEALNVYVAKNPQFSTFTDMYNAFVTADTEQVMTTSWGAPENSNPDVMTDDAIFMQGAAQGMSMFAAAGDNGSGDGTGGSNMADFPSVDPYVAAANGTDLYADINGNYLHENAWADTGGAISAIFGEPAWQTGPGVPQNGWRNNSDLSMEAGSVHPYLLLYQGAWYTVWGTSAVAPQLAGLFATAVSQNGGASLGQSNEAIYNVVNANPGNYASDFRDVTTGSNGAYSAGTDWDHPTGFGSPIGVNLVASLVAGAGATCPAGYQEYDGSLTPGHHAVTPRYSAPAGTENGILIAPSDFRLYVVFYSAQHGRIIRGAGPSDAIHHWAPAGQFQWAATASPGGSGGNYAICVNHP